MIARTIPSIVVGLRLAGLFCAVWHIALHAQPPITVAAHLQVKLEAKVADGWTVRDADLQQNFQHVWTSLDVENRSSFAAVSEVRFYAEYFDSLDRLCFTSAFRLGENVQGLKGPIGAGQVRGLVSFSPGFGTAVQPVQVRVHLVAQGRQDLAGPVTLEVENVKMRIPATIGGGDPPAWRWLLASNSFRKGPPVQDLLLAEVKLGINGSILRVRVCNAAAPEIGSWFLRSVHELPFHSASTGGVPEESTALVLVRTADYPGENIPTSAYAYPAWRSEWVRSYVAQCRGREVPPVSQIVYVPGRHIAWPFSPVWQYFSTGTDWALNIFRRVTDPITGKCCQLRWGTEQGDLR